MTTPEEPGPASIFAGQMDGPEAVAAERWRAAEAQLYSLIVADSDLYTLAVTLVVEARDLLRSECMTVSALMEASAADVLARCATAPKVQAEGFEPRAAFYAACAARLRELQQVEEDR